MSSAASFEPDSFKEVLVPSLAGKRPKINQNYNLDPKGPQRKNKIVYVGRRCCSHIHKARNMCSVWGSAPATAVGAAPLSQALHYSGGHDHKIDI